MTDTTGGSLLQTAFEATELTLLEFWLRYFALGGNASIGEVGGFLAEHSTPTQQEHNVLALTLNERFMDMGLDSSVPYQETT